MQDALKETEAAAQERVALLERVQRLQRRLEEEASGRAALRYKAQRKLATAEQEVRGVAGVVVRGGSPEGESPCAPHSAQLPT